MQNKHIRISAALLALALVLALVPGGALPVRAEEALTPLVSNILETDAQTVLRRGFLIPEADGSLTRVEALDNRVTVETWDESLQLRSSRQLPEELPLFGGFYAGPSQRFLLYGQTNDAEEDTKEVYRLVIYSADWQRLGAVSVYGNNTTIPFRAGSVDMTGD